MGRAIHVVAIAMGLVLVLGSAGPAWADDLSTPPPLPYSGQVAQTPAGQTGATVSDTSKRATGPPSSVTKAPAPPVTTPPAPPAVTKPSLPAGKKRPSKVKLRRRCVTRRGSRIRICRTYRGRRLVKVCTKKPRQKRQHCHRIRSRKAAAEQGPRVSNAEIARARVVLAQASSYINADFTANPLPAVVRLYESGSPVPDRGWCSGALLKRGIVLTAAHCLYDNGEEDKSTAHWYPFANGQMQVVPGNTIGANGTNSFPYGVWNVANEFVPPQYTGQSGFSSDTTYDWGIVQLAPAADGSYAGDYTGTLTANWSVGGITSGTELWSTGYPASGIFRQPSFNYGERQFYCDSTLDSVQTIEQSYWLIYPCKGTGGISGGPMFTKLSDGSWTIIGVHNRGEQTTDPALYFGTNAHNMWADDRFGAFWNNTIDYITTHG
jgi:V8-like Glu-specific endopeptidase